MANIFRRTAPTTCVSVFRVGRRCPRACRKAVEASLYLLQPHPRAKESAFCRTLSQPIGKTLLNSNHVCSRRKELRVPVTKTQEVRTRWSAFPEENLAVGKSRQSKRQKRRHGAVTTRGSVRSPAGPVPSPRANATAGCGRPISAEGPPRDGRGLPVVRPAHTEAGLLRSRTLQPEK